MRPAACPHCASPQALPHSTPHTCRCRTHPSNTGGSGTRGQVSGRVLSGGVLVPLVQGEVSTWQASNKILGPPAFASSPQPGPPWSQGRAGGDKWPLLRHRQGAQKHRPVRGLQMELQGGCAQQGPNPAPMGFPGQHVSPMPSGGPDLETLGLPATPTRLHSAHLQGRVPARGRGPPQVQGCFAFPDSPSGPYPAALASGSNLCG